MTSYDRNIRDFADPSSDLYSGFTPDIYGYSWRGDNKNTEFD